jgi:sporulation protein YlmC with PRC-barrel domain
MNRTSILGAGAALLLTTIPALAQTIQSEPSAQTEPTATSDRPIMPNAPSGSPSAVDVTKSKAPGAFDEMRANQLIGQSIYNAAGESMGEIDDILVNKNDKSSAALVGTGGFLGIGERQIAVPLSDLAMQNGRIVATKLQKADLQRMAAHEANDWVKYDGDRLIGDTTAR